MRTRFRAAIAIILTVPIGVLTTAAAPQAASAQATDSCCIVRGERWFTGPNQAADCIAAGEALLSSWDGYHCTPVDDRTHLTYWRIIS